MGMIENRDIIPEKKLRLRLATNQDSKEIISLIANVLKEYNLPLFLDSSDAELYDIWGNYFATGGMFKVLETDEGKIIGTVALRGINKKMSELRRMYLLPEYRGKGYGKYLLLVALSRAKSLGFSQVILDTSSSLTEAINLYKKFGFRPTQPLESNHSCDKFFTLDLRDFDEKSIVDQISPSIANNPEANQRKEH